MAKKNKRNQSNKAPAPSITQNNENTATGVINTGSGDVIINNNGYSIEQHEQRLKAAKDEVTEYLNQIHSGKTAVLKLENQRKKQLTEQKVAAITTQLTNLFVIFDSKK
jgi:malonyl CoA-acyl carrier protein transacylase